MGGVINLTYLLLAQSQEMGRYLGAVARGLCVCAQIAIGVSADGTRLRLRVCLCSQSALSLPAARSLIYDRDFHLVSLPLQYQQVVVDGMESPADTFRIASPS